jgi:hypothetical protein
VSSYHNPATDGHVVDLHKINLAAEGLSQHVAVDHFSEALSQDDKGLWHFGITITLQEGTSFEQQLSTAARGKEVPITMPRFARFYLHIQFSLRDTECNFQNARETTKTFPFKFTNNILVGPPDAYAYLAGILDTIFRTKPGEPPVSQPIGFDLGSRH